MGPDSQPNSGPIILVDGPFAGWTSWSRGGDAFETLIGPFCFRLDDARVRCAFQPRAEHLNTGGAVHGGALMSFADFSLFAIAHNALRGQPAVTISCNCEFLSAGGVENWIEAGGEVLRETGSLVFARGIVTQGQRPLLAFSGTLKKIAAPRE
jgi:uncharacterized protein (TIGR00369 family)